MSKKHKKRLREMTEEINPEELMPLPERLKNGDIIKDSPPIYDAGSVYIPSEPVEPPDEPTEALELKKIKVQPEIVEPGYFSTKVNLYRR